MAYIERDDEAIILAYEQWVQNRPEQIIRIGDEEISSLELVPALRRKDPMITNCFITVVRELAKKLDMDPVGVILLSLEMN